MREAHQKELDYCSGLERLQGEMEFRVTEAERAREDALYDGVNLHVNLANKEEAIRELRIQVAKLEVLDPVAWWSPTTEGSILTDHRLRI